MYVEIKRAKTLMVAETWKDLFDGEGIPSRIIPVSGIENMGQELTEYRVLVPEDRQSVIKEILKKL
jgi:hypothetical protein